MIVEDKDYFLADLLVLPFHSFSPLSAKLPLVDLFSDL